MQPSLSPSLLRDHWRHLLLAVVVFGSLALMLSQQRIGQDPAYHGFADRRAFFGIPNFFDVTSNLAFLVVGAMGLRICLRDRMGKCRNAWLALFAGVTLVGFGSAYFHWDPNDQTLVWDRLPMTIGFMGLFAALVGEHIGDRFAGFLLAPALLLGVASVVYWHWSGDLRFYYWVQLIALLGDPRRVGPVPRPILTPVAAPRGPRLLRARESHGGQRRGRLRLHPGSGQWPHDQRLPVRAGMLDRRVHAPPKKADRMVTAPSNGALDGSRQAAPHRDSYRRPCRRNR